MSTIGQCFQTESYPVKDFLSLSAVLNDYLNESEKLKPFVSTFQKLDDLEQNIKAKQGSFKNRDLLTSVLQKQLSGLQLNETQQENLQKLSDSNTFCITTAHQTNLFGGPLYFIQKAVSVIKACRLAKEKFPMYDFVPMYWLGTEDHDFEELNHTRVNGQKLTWKDEQGGAFGRYKTDSLADVLVELNQILGESDRAIYLKELFAKAYKQEETIAAATTVLLHEMLGEYGLLIIDGDDVELKQQMIPVFERELKDSFSTEAAQQSISFLEQNYGKSQAHSRAINLFYLTEHSRKRIVKQGDDFSIHGTKLQFRESELLDELQKHPERFSPNVMLRPLMQEMCLPNLMYVGGGGETSYWFQLKPIFDAVNEPFPMLGLRDTAVYLSKKTKKKINQLAVETPFFFDAKENIIKQLVARDTANSLELDNAKNLVDQAMSEMQKKARAIDFTLSASAKAEEQRMMNALSNLEKKMMRAEKKNHKVLLERVAVIFDEIYPHNSLQERSQNFSQYYLRYGKSWIDWMLENFNLFDQKMKVMVEAECD